MKMIYPISALLIRQFRGNVEFASMRFLVFSLGALCVLCGSTVAQDFKTVHNGIEYAEVTREFSGKPVKINLLRLDLRKVRLDVIHAKDRAIGTETTSSIASRHGAVAAINAGFFRLDTSPYLGDPVGLFMIDGKLLSETTNDRIQLVINNRPAQSEIIFARSRYSQTIAIGSETFSISGINRELKSDDLVMYTPDFGDTTLAIREGVELVIVNEKIVSIQSNVGNSAIPPNGYVLSGSGSFMSKLSAAASKTKKTRLVYRWEGLLAEAAKNRANIDIVTGVPQLINGGKIDITWEQEKSSKAFVETRHPRTAVAKLKDGKFLMLAADGRSKTSAGLDLYDLAKYMLELGAVDAMNLDGGGSTTMYLDEKVVNRPSDASGERKVSDAIIVTLRGKVVRRMR